MQDRHMVTTVAYWIASLPITLTLWRPLFHLPRSVLSVRVSGCQKLQ